MKRKLITIGLLLSSSLVASTIPVEIFPSVISSEKAIIFNNSANIKDSGLSLQTPVIETDKTRAKCGFFRRECKATSLAPSSLKQFTVRSNITDEILDISEDTVLNSSKLPNINIDKDNLTITFDAQLDEKGVERILHIGKITDYAKNSTYIFKAGDYHIESIEIDNDTGNRKKRLHDSVKFIAKGNVRIFVKDKLIINKSSISNTTKPAISINCPTKQYVKKLFGFVPHWLYTPEAEADPSQMLIIAGGKMKITTKGEFAVNSIIYGYNTIEFNGMPLSRFNGAVHASKELYIGSDDRRRVPTGTFSYYEDAIDKLYTIDTLQVLPPNEDDTSTILGTDSNRNGVRDDVEYYIVERYKDSQMERAIAFQVARAAQIIVAEPENAFETTKVMDKAQDCSFYFEDKTNKEMTYRMFDAIYKDKLFNTKERLLAYFKYNEVLSGHTFKLEDYSVEDCDINIDELEN